MVDLYDALIAQPSIRVGFQELSELLVAGFHRLKPGAHAVVLSAQGQTWNTARALEEAGFVVRDAVVNVMDRSAEKEVFLTSLTPTQRSEFERLWPSLVGNKPAVGVWWIARKPLQENTVAEQVLATGTGAINIEACRVASNGEHKVSTVGPENPQGCTYGYSKDRRGFEPTNADGRWPANLVLQHGPGCKRVGTKKIKSQNPVYVSEGKGSGEGGSAQMLKGSFRPAGKGIGFADADGLETIDAWECPPSCPVRSLDEQSGNFPPSFRKARTGSSSRFLFGKMKDNGEPLGYTDSGGASRFFNMFASNDELLEHFLRLIVPPGGRVLDLGGVDPPCR